MLSSKSDNNKVIWTIGHSTRTADEFIELLKAFQIQLLADVRSFPGSKRFPHFNKSSLSELLKQHSIEYIHLPELGGRRKAKPESHNIAWRNEAFRGYADYMETEDFKQGIERLQSMAAVQRTAYMCSEAVWWRCHRSLISDYLKTQGWIVIHILKANNSEEHPFTKPARIINGKLDYSNGEIALL